jgi:hypothetical protein
MGSHHIFYASIVWKFCLPCALCCLIITACSTTGQQGRANTPAAHSTPTMGSTPTARSAPKAHNTPPPSSSSPTACGTITIQQGTTGGMAPQSMQQPDPQQVSQCFWSAFQQCHPATLRFVVISTTTETTRTFTIAQGTQGCTVSDTVQRGSASLEPDTTINVYPCTNVLNSSTQMLISRCGADGNITIPITQNNMHPAQQGGPIMVPAGHV